MLLMNEIMMTNQVRSKCINEAFKSVLDHPKDVTIVSAENQIVYVNRLLLSLFSSTLSPLLSSPTCSPSSIILPDCSIYSIKQLFEVLQKGFTSMNKDDGSKLIETAKIMGISIDKLNENNGQLNNEKENNADKNTPFNLLKKRYKSGPEKRKVEVIGSQPLSKKRNKSGPVNVAISHSVNNKLKSDDLKKSTKEIIVHQTPQQPSHKQQQNWQNPPQPKQTNHKQQQNQQIPPQPKQTNHKQQQNQQILPQPKQTNHPQQKQLTPPTPKKQIPPQSKQQIHPPEKQSQQILPQSKQQIPHYQKQQIHPHPKQQSYPQEKKISKDHIKETPELILPPKESPAFASHKEKIVHIDPMNTSLIIKDEPIEVDDPLIDVIDISVKTAEINGDIQNKEKNLVELNKDIPDISSAVQNLIDVRQVTPIPIEVPKTIINKDVLNEVFSSIKDEPIGINEDIPNKTLGSGHTVFKTSDQLYLCQICSKNIPKNRLREHYSRHFTNEMKEFENLAKENECLICKKRFASKHSCLRHIGIAHDKLDEYLVEKGLVPILNKNESKRMKRKEKSKVQCSSENEASGMSENLEEILDELKIIPSNNQGTTETPTLQKTCQELNICVINEENIPMEIDENPIKIEPLYVNETPNIERNVPEEDPKAKNNDGLQTTINSDILDKVCSSIKEEPVEVDVPNTETVSLVEPPQTTIDQDILDSVCSVIKDEPAVMDDSLNNENNIPMESGNSKTVIDKDTLDTVCSTMKDELSDLYTDEDTIKKNLERLESCQISVKDCLNLVKENECIYCQKIFFHKKILQRHIRKAHKKDDDEKDDDTISEKGILPVNKRFANTRVDKSRTTGLNKRKVILQGSKLPSKQRHGRYEKKRA